MGLDTVEFVMGVEEAFGLFIPDSDAQNLTTPGQRPGARFSIRRTSGDSGTSSGTSCLSHHGRRSDRCLVLPRPPIRSVIPPAHSFDLRPRHSCQRKKAGIGRRSKQPFAG